MKLDDFLDILACPGCKGDLTYLRSHGRLRCPACEREYSVIDDVPVFLDDDTFARFNSGEPGDGGFKGFLRKRLGFVPSLTTWTDKSIFTYLNDLKEGALVLNLGAGVGRFDEMIRHQMINLDVCLGETTDLVADAHRFPFRDGSLDCVFSNAVLEHLERPWVVAEEIYRVLKTGGLVCVNVPFLNVGHEAFDFHRFTDQGLRSLFHRFREIKTGVSSGPGSFATYFIPEYISLFFPFAKLRAALRYALSGLFLPLKYADRYLKRRERYRIIADAFYFVGRKSNGGCGWNREGE